MSYCNDGIIFKYQIYFHVYHSSLKINNSNTQCKFTNKNV